jgi:hypothetical protein
MFVESICLNDVHDEVREIAGEAMEELGSEKARM